MIKPDIPDLMAGIDRRDMVSLLGMAAAGGFAASSPVRAASSKIDFDNPHQKLDAFSVAIASLPKRYQEAFVRRRIWGESCREIAEAMQLSEPAVSNYAALGWKLLVEHCKEREIVLDDFTDEE